ncbi:hypothetical protein B1B04_08465 [Lysinibacillus sp. KCTC 33748]|uniref:DUF4054 domain-containing protein n=1 Tax=unclassified Lysinibacillus TaxID=2636778 RepID=UPI0009A75D4A|nr:MULTISPECIES: DUF4054 domain-containing protein [unclassified Lysinibacillus]OXS74911.1 hypothetical protein B1B04_08465 [Lysinibacillus sp. KCTC 33748]SKB59818.1 Protein of unknown function [Lysinibacillus sp. AC-3]
MLLTSIERIHMLSDEFTSISDERLTMYIEDASLEVSSLPVPEIYQERLARYLAAHLAILSVSKDQTVIREKVDIIERQYSAPNKNIGLLASKWGQEYQRILDELEEQIKPKKSINLMVL